MNKFKYKLTCIVCGLYVLGVGEGLICLEKAVLKLRTQQMRNEEGNGGSGSSIPVQEVMSILCGLTEGQRDGGKR